MAIKIFKESRFNKRVSNILNIWLTTVQRKSRLNAIATRFNCYIVGAYFSRIISQWSSVTRWQKYSTNVIGARIKQTRNKNTVKRAFNDMKDVYKLLMQE